MDWAGLVEFVLVYALATAAFHLAFTLLMRRIQ